MSEELRLLQQQIEDAKYSIEKKMRKLRDSKRVQTPEYFKASDELYLVKKAWDIISGI